MNNNKIIKWGILGTARIARKKMITAIKSVEGPKGCLAVASRDIEKAENVVKDFGIERHYGSYEQLLEDKDIDAVYIPLPNSLHYPWVIRAAESGKHILCEKPLGFSVSQMQEMIRVCKERNVLLMEAHSYFLHPRYARLFELLDDNVIGSVRQIQVHFSFPASEQIHAIRFDTSLGGGSLLDIGCYGVDFAQKVFNREVQNVQAIFDMDINRKIDMECLGILSYDENTEAIIRSSFRKQRRQTILLSGENGNIFLPDAFIPTIDNTFIFIDTPGKNRVEEIPNTNQYALLIKNFRERIQDKKDMDTIYDGYLQNANTLEKFIKLHK